jgi:uncharacterized protein
MSNIQTIKTSENNETVQKTSSIELLPNGFSRKQIAIAVSPHIQEFILFPTEKCNFRCTYCYEDFEIGKMSKSLQRAIEILLEQRIIGLKRLSFSWFGGEPLLAHDVVLRLSKHAKMLSEIHGTSFHGGMTTNAYLLNKDLADELIENNQNFFQITLDGMADEHDKLRKRADGKGTFKEIWSNLEGLHSLSAKFECVLRLHVRRDNIESLKNLLCEIAKSFGLDSRFRLDFQHLRDMGGEGGKSVVSPLSRAELRQVEVQLRQAYNQAIINEISNSRITTDNMHQPQVLIEPPSSDFDRGESAGSQRASDIALGEPYICYAAKPNSLIIRANGRIGKCTVALDDARNDLGYLADDGSLILNEKKLLPWVRGIEILDSNITSCPLNGMPISDLASPTKSPTKQIKIIQLD